MLTIEEVEPLVETWVQRLSFSGLSFELISQRSSSSIEVCCAYNEHILCLFSITADSVHVVKCGEAFVSFVQDYSFVNKIGLFAIFYSLLAPIYSTAISIAAYSSLLLGGKVRSWISFVTLLISDLDLEINKDGNSLILGKAKISLDKEKHQITYSNLIEITGEYEDELSLVQLILSYVVDYFVVQEKDIVVFDRDDALLLPEASPEETSSAPSSPGLDVDISNELDMPASDIDLPDDSSDVESGAPEENIDELV